MELWEEIMRAGLDWLRLGRAWQRQAIGLQSLGERRTLASEASTAGRLSEQDLALLLGAGGRLAEPGKRVRQGADNLRRSGGLSKPKEWPNLPALLDLPVMPTNSQKAAREQPPADLTVALPAMPARQPVERPLQAAAALVAPVEREIDQARLIVAEPESVKQRNFLLRDEAGEAENSPELAVKPLATSIREPVVEMAAPAISLTNMVVPASGVHMPIAEEKERAQTAQSNLTAEAVRAEKSAAERWTDQRNFVAAASGASGDLDSLADLVAERLCDDIEVLLNSSSLV